jgi:hypothetical protein
MQSFVVVLPTLPVTAMILVRNSKRRQIAATVSATIRTTQT